jgi:hypothetical protein
MSQWNVMSLDSRTLLSGDDPGHYAEALQSTKVAVRLHLSKW